MEEIASQFLSLYGPLAIGWVVAAVLGWIVLSERNRKLISSGTESHMTLYMDMLEDYHQAIVANTRAMERLAILIEERTRRQP